MAAANSTVEESNNNEDVITTVAPSGETATEAPSAEVPPAEETVTEAPPAKVSPTRTATATSSQAASQTLPRDNDINTNCLRNNPYSKNFKNTVDENQTVAIASGTTTKRIETITVMLSSSRISKSVKDIHEKLGKLILNEARNTPEVLVDAVKCLFKEFSREDVQEALVSYFPDPEHTFVTWTPLIWAIKNKAPIDALQLLLNYDVTKKSIFISDSTGCLPIHWACLDHNDRTPIEVIKMLIESDESKTTLFTKDSRCCKLPINFAWRHGESSSETTKVLFDAMMKSGHKVDWDSLIDHERDSQKEVLQLVFRYAIIDRLEHLRVEEWERAMQRLVDNVPDKYLSRKAHIQKFKEKLEMYEALARNGPLLTLAIWKAQCFTDLKNGDKSSFKCLDEEYKQTSLYLCKANVVVPKVLSFLGPLDDNDDDNKSSGRGMLGKMGRLTPFLADMYLDM